MRTRAFVLLALVGCGNDGATPSDGRTADEQPPDAPIDAKPPNTTHRGLIQGVRLGASTSPPGIGFYEVPSTAAGCTWTYAGGCSLQSCEQTAGHVAVSAGDITYTVGTASATFMPDGSARYTGTPPAPLASGTTVTASAAGAAVPAFTTGTLVTPDPITVTAPASDAVIMRVQPLTVSWTPTAGQVYVNISQTQNGGPYPATYARTIRCDVAASLGTIDLPTELLAGLEAGMQANFVAAAMVTESQDAGDYEVTFRVLVADMLRQLPVE